MKIITIAKLGVLSFAGYSAYQGWKAAKAEATTEERVEVVATRSPNNASRRQI